MINAILGEEIVPVDVTTETVTVNRISFGLPVNEAILSGGRSVRLADHDLKRENLEKLMLELGEPVRWLEIRRPCEILKKITIIDTPGNGDAMQDFSEAVKESLLRSDAVIYVFNVQYPLSKSEQMFLKAAVLPQKYTSIFMAGNFSDTLETEEAYRKMEDMLKQRVRNLLPDTEPYMVSALDELSRQIGEEYEKTPLTPVLHARFLDLRDSLDRLAESRKDHVVVDRMQRLAMAMALDLESMLDALDQGLGMDIADADSVMQEAKSARENGVIGNVQLLKDMDAVIQDMKTEANAWMGEFIRRMVEESENLSEMSNDDLKRYYEFYCVDLLQEAMNACVEYHKECLLDLMDSIADGVSAKAVSGLHTNNRYHFRIQLDSRIWTKGDTVGLATSFVASANYLTFVTSIVADGISGAMREREKQNRVQELVGQISRKLLNMSAMVSETVERVYGDLGEKAKQLLADYYEERMAQTQLLLEQTAQAAAKSTSEKASVKAVLEKTRTALDKLMKTVAAV